MQATSFVSGTPLSQLEAVVQRPPLALVQLVVHAAAWACGAPSRATAIAASATSSTPHIGARRAASESTRPLEPAVATRSSYGRALGRVAAEAATGPAPH